MNKKICVSLEKKISLVLSLTPSDPKDTFQMRGLSQPSQGHDTKVSLFSSQTTTDVCIAQTVQTIP